jgi:putative transposase
MATTGGIDSGDVRDLMTESVERRFGLMNRLPVPIEWLSDKGLALTSRATHALAREIGLAPCTTPIEIPQSNRTVEAFVAFQARLCTGQPVPTRPPCCAGSTAGIVPT